MCITLRLLKINDQMSSSLVRWHVQKNMFGLQPSEPGCVSDICSGKGLFLSNNVIQGRSCLGDVIMAKAYATSFCCRLAEFNTILKNFFWPFSKFFLWVETSRLLLEIFCNAYLLVSWKNESTPMDLMKYIFKDTDLKQMSI